MMHVYFPGENGRARNVPMDRRDCFFGGDARGKVTIANGHAETMKIDHDVWFDQDIDGRWPVWVVAHDGVPGSGLNDDQTGAIVVKNRDAVAFIEFQGKLTADPVGFDHEPAFHGADGTTDVSVRQSRT